MGGINNKPWRMKAVLRTLSPLTPPGREISPSPRAGWSVRIHLSHTEIHPSDHWRHFTPPCPLRPARQPPEADAGPRINERRGWIDPAP